MPYLTALIKDKTALTYRYYVELVSTELDFEGVPCRTQIVDVVVVEPTETAVKSLIAATKWLEGYRIVACWTPADECPFQFSGDVGVVLFHPY